MDWPAILSSLVTGAGAVATIIGTLVTAVATVFLWRVTKVLAVETRRMADASAQPQVVVSIEPNQWAMMYADITVANTGNATAFDIVVVFDPPIQRENSEAERPFPLERVSLLRPGRKITNFLSSFEPLLNHTYEATVSWKRDPRTDQRQSLTYQINMADFEGRGHLGAASPITQIADEIKKMRDDWRPVTQGQRKISTDVFSSLDRLHQRREHQRYRRRLMREQAAETPPASNSESDDRGEE